MQEIVRSGRCPTCGAAYMWDVEDTQAARDSGRDLLLRDAVCRDCEVPLKAVGRKRAQGVTHVEPGWLRRTPGG